MTTLRPPREVLWIAERLESAGFETWCVGGAVRDALLGLEHLDWDLATAATPDEVQRLFKRTKPTGIKFGTILVFGRDGGKHEVTTFRRDVRTDGRHAEVEFGVSLDEDLARRDFTINAIAYSPGRDAIHDPFGGRADLARGIVRAVGDAGARMREDRLRALRAIRFAARFEFEIDPATWPAIVESSPHLGRLSAERVQEEIQKTMRQVLRPSIAFSRWQESGALATLVPGVTLSPVALETLDLLAVPGPASRPHRTTARIAALFLDVDPAKVEEVLRGLRFSRTDMAWIVALVEKWGRVGEPMRGALAGNGSGEAGVRRAGRLAKGGTATASSAVHPDDLRLRKWVALIGRTRVTGFMRIAAARWQAMANAGEPAPSPAAIRSVYRRMQRIAWRDPLELGDLAIDGEDLRRIGVPPGPRMGAILHALLDDVIEDPASNAPDRLLARARAIAERGANRVEE